MAMKIGVPNEVHAGEQRAALTPETAEQLQKLGFDVTMEAGAGQSAQFVLSDAASPTIVRDASDESALYVLMPMRV